MQPVAPNQVQPRARGVRGLRSFGLLELSMLLASTGAGAALVALPWLVLETTGSAVATGSVTAFAAVPLFLATFASGALSDRLGRRRVALVFTALSAAVAASVPLCSAAVGLPLALILVIAAAAAICEPMSVTAKESMIPEAAHVSGLRLERANGIHEAVTSVAFLVGPGLAGVLIATVGDIGTYWAIAALFVASTLALVPAAVPGSGRPESNPEAFLASVRSGVRAVWRDPLLRTLAAVLAAVIGMWLPIEQVVLPVVYNQEGSPARLGLLVTVLGTGGFIGAVLYAWLGPRLPRRAVLVTSLIGTSIPVLLMAPLPSYPVMLVLALASGFFFGPVMPLVNLSIQSRSEERMRGRVLGVVASSAMVAGPFGFLVSGPLIESFGVSAAFTCFAVLILAVGVASIWMRSLRGLDELPTADAHLPASEPRLQLRDDVAGQTSGRDGESQ